MRIAINPGHYPGLDSGACGKHVTEANVALEIANVVVDNLQEYETKLVQANELWEICKISNDFDADIFCSIHLNACASHTAEGTETYSVSYGGCILARHVQHHLLKAMGSVNRGLKQANFTVLTDTNAIACLTEVDFIDNYKRELYVTEHIQEIGVAIADGIKSYIESLGD